MRATSLVLAFALAIAACAARAAEAPPAPELKAYSLGFADGPSTAEIVRTLVGEGGKVMFDPGTRKLLVVTTQDKQAQVAQVIKELDVPPKNVRIEVLFKEHGRGTEQKAAVQGRGQVVVDDAGSRAIVQVRPQLQDTSTQTSSNTKQELLVTSGRPASIFVGETIPYLDWLIDYGLQYGYLQQRVEWQKIGAQLVVEPTVIGDGPMICVRLTPELSGLVNGNPCRTRFANVATEVTVADGVPFALGGLTQHRDFYTRFLIGVDRAGSQQALDIVLTARIVPPAPR
jgi:type II secretory pathway component HofQ